MGRIGSRSLDAPSFVLITHIENHSQFSNLPPPLWLGLKWYALGSFCRNEIIMPGMSLERMFPYPKAMSDLSHFFFLLQKPNPMKQQCIFPGVIRHAFLISVTLDRMYTSRGNIQKAESTAGMLIA